MLQQHSDSKLGDSHLDGVPLLLPCRTGSVACWSPEIVLRTRRTQPREPRGMRQNLSAFRMSRTFTMREYATSCNIRSSQMSFYPSMASGKQVLSAWVIVHRSSLQKKVSNCKYFYITSAMCYEALWQVLQEVSVPLQLGPWCHRDIKWQNIMQHKNFESGPTRFVRVQHVLQPLFQLFQQQLHMLTPGLFRY